MCIAVPSKRVSFRPLRVYRFPSIAYNAESSVRPGAERKYGVKVFLFALVERNGTGIN